MRLVVLVLSYVLSLLAPVGAYGYQLSPEGSQVEIDLTNYDKAALERYLSRWAFDGIKTFGTPVHEEITNRILGCNGDELFCKKPTRIPKAANIMAGVRWNDDPPFRFESGYGKFAGCSAGNTIRFVTYPECWLRVFLASEKQVEAGKQITNKSPLMVRSHFGDLQFLHSMASDGNEDPKVTRGHILTWAEFTWRLALKEYSPSTLLKDIPVEGMKEIFGMNGWDINDIFRLGNPQLEGIDNLAEVAFGSLLHVVEDSFALGHVERAYPDSNQECTGTKIIAPGKIREFHAYNLQNSKRHADDDSRDAFATHWADPSPNVVDVGRVLYGYYKEKASWDIVKPYIECVFELHQEVRKATAGDKYRR